MTQKGIVSTVDNAARKARVAFMDRDENVTSELPVSPHVGVLNVNDLVAVIFFSDSLSDGLVIAKF